MKNAFVALTLCASAAFGKMSLEETSCTIYEDYTTWDLRPMTVKDGAYYTNSDGSLTWNTC